MKVSNTHRFFAVSSLVLLGFVFLMVSSEFSPFIQLEQKTAQLVEQSFGYPQMSYSNGLGNSMLTFLATYGSATYISITTSIIAVIFFLKGDKGLAIWFLGVVSSGGIFGIFLKNFFKRERPMNHLSFDDGFSFPSGHAIASTLFFLAILLVFLPLVQNLPIRILLTGLGFLVWGAILFSRIYFHAHFVGDLLAGVSLGVFWVLASMNVYNFVVNIVEQFWIYQ